MFNWSGLFRSGSWTAYREFVLNQRRDVLARINTISLELSKIGDVIVVYGTENGRVTESRIGLAVQEGTSLEKLVQAYVANGGNPFDISMFLRPDSAIVVGATTNSEGEEVATLSQVNPYGGVLSSASGEPTSAGIYTGGWLPLWKYPPRKLGNNISYLEEMADLSFTVTRTRIWVSKEIRRMGELEQRIIKLCDLREQLLYERDVLIPQAVGGVVEGVPLGESGTEFAVSHHVSYVIHEIDKVIYGDPVDLSNPRRDVPNPAFPTILEDAPTGEEDWHSL